MNCTPDSVAKAYRFEREPSGFAIRVCRALPQLRRIIETVLKNEERYGDH